MAKKTISDKEYFASLIISEDVAGEPERYEKYIAEKPFDLTKYEHSLFKKGFGSDLFSSSFFGAAVAYCIVVIGKCISALINKESPTIEKWEIYAILIGFIGFLLLKIRPLLLKTKEEKEFKDINTNIVEHFEDQLKKSVYIAEEKEGD